VLLPKVQVLVSHGADMDATTIEGLSSFHIACRNNHKLVSHGEVARPMQFWIFIEVNDWQSNCRFTR
jgi:ankyrin repeat protein